jgi:hypothetical protein
MEDGRVRRIEGEEDGKVEGHEGKRWRMERWEEMKERKVERFKGVKVRDVEDRRVGRIEDERGRWKRETYLNAGVEKTNALEGDRGRRWKVEVTEKCERADEKSKEYFEMREVEDGKVEWGYLKVAEEESGKAKGIWGGRYERWKN